jgi:hypothetical protein
MYKLQTQGFPLGFAAPRLQRSTSFALALIPKLEMMQ